MVRSLALGLAALAGALALIAAIAIAASPDAWEDYEAQVRADCGDALDREGFSVVAQGPVVHGSDPVGSFVLLSASPGSADPINWLCRAPRGDGALAVELIEVPADYAIGYPEPAAEPL